MSGTLDLIIGNGYRVGDFDATIVAIANDQFGLEISGSICPIQKVLQKNGKPLTIHFTFEGNELEAPITPSPLKQ